MQRKSLPNREGRYVETEDRQDQQRKMQKQQRQAGINCQHPPGALHNSPSASRRTEASNNSITSAIKTSDAAEPKGQSRAFVNWFCIRFPTITDFPPPRRSGVRYAPRQGMNTRTSPARIPGPHSGTTTRNNAVKGLAPRSAAASNRFGSSRSSAAYKGRTMNGR